MTLTGIYGAECTTGSLDNEELIDYITNHQAVFNSGSPDDGLGDCNNVSYYDNMTSNDITKSLTIMISV